MPMIWTEPKIFAKLNTGEKVCHCYKHTSVMTFHYQILSSREGIWMAFDVRNLAVYLNMKTSALQQHLKVIQAALAILGPTLEDAITATQIWYEGEG